MNQIMNKDVLSKEGTCTIQEAAEAMKKSRVGCVIITKGQRSTGIITERDFVTKVAAEGRPLFTEISEIMSSPLITINHEETVWEASEIMKERKIHKLPVENSGKIVGIITTSDIVKISSVGSDSEMRKICDQILMRMKNE